MPLSDQPIVFLEKEFLLALCREMGKPFISINSPKQNIIFLEELIFNRSKIYIDLSNSEIEELLQDDPERPLNKIGLALILKKLSNINKISSCKEIITHYKNKKCGEIIEQLIIPHYLLLNEDVQTCKSIQEVMGIICISVDFKSEEYNIRFGMHYINANKRWNIKEFVTKITRGNCLIIEDPYFHTQRESFIENLISVLHSQGLLFSHLQIMIIVQDHEKLETIRITNDYNKPINHKKRKQNRGKSLEDLIRENKKIKTFKDQYKKLQEFASSSNAKFNRNIKVIKIESKLHDRNIYSNTYWISCESGICEQYNSPTKWNFHPLGLYYSGYRQKLKDVASWLKNQKIQHPLLTA